MISNADIAVLAAIISATAAVAAALISALISFSIAKRGASQKLAEMRQAWIDDLRDQIAYYVKLTHKIGASYIYATDKEKIGVELQDEYAELFEIEYYVRLKLNPAETDHQALVQKMVETRRLVNKFAGSDGSVKDFQSCRMDLVNIGKRVLKLEWDRLKDEVHGRGYLHRTIRNWIKSRLHHPEPAEWKELERS